MWQWIEHKLQTWQGILAAIIAACASAAATFVAIRRGATLLVAAYTGGLFVVKIEEHLGEMKKELLARMDKLDDGQANIIQARRAVMEEDQQKAWFEADPSGRFIWANRMWRTITGMESDNVRGHGWEAGIHHEDREEALIDWRAAFDHQRLFERPLRLANTRTGHRCSVRLTAWPIRRESDGQILSYLGHATITPSTNEHRQSSSGPSPTSKD